MTASIASFYRRIALVSILFIVAFAFSKDLSYCMESSYITKSYHPSRSSRKMPLLLGMPDSGVIWMRDIIEQFTGKYTGSMGNINGSKNVVLQKLFPNGEFCSNAANTIACDQPFWVHVAKHGTVSFSNKAQERYCRSGGLFSFHYVIFMARYPYDAIVKGYQRYCQSMGKMTDFRSIEWPKYARTAAAEYAKIWPRLQPILQEMGSKLTVIRYEHLVDPTRYEGVINGLLVFHNRFPLTPEYISESFKAIDCIEKFPLKQLHDRIDSTQFSGVPFADYKLVLDMSAKLDLYNSHFGYDAFPQYNYSTADVAGIVAEDYESDFYSLFGVSTNASNCEIVNASITYAKQAIVETSESAPPLLLSLPGMNNNWLRKLIEMATGIYTGSLGEIDGSSNPKLEELFVGEKFCGRRFSVINCGAPNFVRSNSKYKISLDVKAHRVKCRKGVIHEFSKSILYVRNPLDALVEGYLHEVSEDVNIHETAIDMGTSWLQFARDNLAEYDKFWQSTIQYLVEAPSNSVLIVRYEDLLSEASRKTVLRKIITFLGLVAKDGSELKLQSIREDCTDIFAPLNRLSSFQELEFSKAPYEERELLVEMNKTLAPYFRSFGYVLRPHSALSTEISSITYSNELDVLAVPLTQCSEQYNSVTFAPLQTSSTPPLLLSLPGSGSTWFRKLIELVTGWHTGSLGKVDGAIDDDLAAIFVGERYCGRRFAAINCPEPKYVHVSEKLSLSLHAKLHRVKCRKGVIHEFSRAIVLIRNPYDALVSAYKEHMVMATGQDALLMDENWAQFARDAAEDYNTVWKQSIASLLPIWKSISATNNNNNVNYNKVLFVKYEDLLADELRLETIRNISIFLGAFGEGMNATVQLEREMCSYIVSYFKRFHDISNLRFSDFPFDSELLRDITNNIENYLDAFDYDTLPNGPLFGVRREATNAAKQKAQFADLAQPPAIASQSMSLVLNMTYKQPPESYVPPLILNGSVTKLQATLRCAQIFGYRKFWLSAKNTPLLLSFAGSGNTWVRMLIEFATGIYSGSTDMSDKILKEEFVGENYCSSKTSVIKAHPPQMVLAPNSSIVTMVLMDGLQKHKCDSHGMKSFTKFVFITRNPFNAIFAEVNREITASHIGTPSVQAFLASDWYQLLINEAREYEQSWKALSEGLTNPKANIIFLKYENLLNGNLRYNELFKIANFIHPEEVPSLEKLQCAFIQSDVANVHRIKNKDSMNATYLYSNQSLVDEIWNYVKEFSVFAGYSKAIS